MSAKRRQIGPLFLKCASRSSQAHKSVSLSSPAMTTSIVSTQAASPGMSSRRASANAPQISRTCAVGNNATLQSSAWTSLCSNTSTGGIKASHHSPPLFFSASQQLKDEDFKQKIQRDVENIASGCRILLKKPPLNGNITAIVICCCSLFV